MTRPQSLDLKALSKFPSFTYLHRLVLFFLWMSSPNSPPADIGICEKKNKQPLPQQHEIQGTVCPNEDNKPIMEAVIGKTFKAQHSLWLPYPCCHQGPFSEITSKCKSKQKMGNETQLYRAVTSDGPFLLEPPVCAEVGL